MRPLEVAGMHIMPAPGGLFNMAKLPSQPPQVLQATPWLLAPPTCTRACCLWPKHRSVACVGQPRSPHVR